MMSRAVILGVAVRGEVLARTPTDEVDVEEIAVKTAITLRCIQPSAHRMFVRFANKYIDLIASDYQIE